MGIQKIGIEGEREALDLLKSKGYQCFQADWICKRNGEYILVEVKCKEMFKSPPFDGHGLDSYQIKPRLDFYKYADVRPILLVKDIDTQKWIWQWLDVLESGTKFDTKNGMRIYPIENFDSEEAKDGRSKN